MHSGPSQTFLHTGDEPFFFLIYLFEEERVQKQWGGAEGDSLRSVKPRVGLDPRTMGS